MNKFTTIFTKKKKVKAMKFQRQNRKKKLRCPIIITTTNQPLVSRNGTVLELHTIEDQPKIVTVLWTKAKADNSNPKLNRNKQKTSELRSQLINGTTTNATKTHPPS